jgi:hypothetical protein
MSRISVCAFALVVLAAEAGCNNPQFGLPQLANNEPAWYQLNQAKRFDPYPDPNMGPPVVGGRPPGFVQPRPEPDATKNSEFYMNNPSGYPPSAPAVYTPAAPAFAPAPTVSTAPVAPTATNTPLMSSNSAAYGTAIRPTP